MPSFPDDAECRGADTELFVHNSPLSYQNPAVRTAIDVYCSNCPVRRQCLAEELSHPNPYPYQVRGGRLIWQEID